MRLKLLFPVIAWYDIIGGKSQCMLSVLLFPVIAWYDIIKLPLQKVGVPLLFPVIAWYDIIAGSVLHRRVCCCSRLSLGMI